MLPLSRHAAVGSALPLRRVREAGLSRLGRGESRDWSGLWFKLVEETWGEYTGMRGGKLLPDGSIQWTFLPHADYDGIGGFVHLLRRTSSAVHIEMPARKSAKPSWWVRAGALLRLMATKSVPAAAWKGMDPSITARRVGPGSAVATELLDAERTARLVRKARSHGVPLNSLLLSALGRASQAELTPGPARWMMPVNMRGPVSLARDTANQTGYMQIEVAPGASPSTVHEEVKEALRRRDHWATWTLLNAGRIVGYSGMRAIYKLQISRFRERPFVGAFAHLGTWQGHGEWFVCPPVVRTCPVGAGVIICNGRLSMTIEAHPCMSGGAAWSRALMDRWIAEIGV
jgi:hypothetical protein